MLINMFNLRALNIAAVQLLFTWSYGLCQMPLKINPYEQVFKTMLREPPINVNNANRDNNEVKEQWLEQPLDHFDTNNTETWMMRYLVNDNFYQSGAPLFVFVGGEWEISSQILQNGHFYDMAKQQAALMFYTEHRFYGHSWPKNDTSCSNLRFLNVRQSLQDLRNFLIVKKSSSKILHKSKVVLVGGSYSGSMVAWFMQLYPELGSVAWASSPPLMAKMDFEEYMSLTMNSIYQKGGSSCGLKLEKAFSGLSKAMQNDMAFNIEQRLKICKSFDSKNPFDRQAFFNGLGNYFASLAQSYSSFIPQFCLSFANLDTNPTEALIKYLAELFLTPAQLKIRGEEEYCVDFSYEGMKSTFANEHELETGTRPWFYQTCHEFGWFATTTAGFAKIKIPNASANTSTASSAPLAFGGQVPLTFFQQLCQDVFGNGNNSCENLGHGKEPPLTLQQMHNRALTVNKLFGGFSNVSKRVIFTHGLLDPWRAAGLQNGQNVLLIKDYSHVEDMTSINFSDTVEMNVVKLKVAAFINRYLRHY